MFDAPPGSDSDPTLVVSPMLTVADWHTIIDALSAQEASRAQHLCTHLRRYMNGCERQDVWVSNETS
jgi:hypothetical protein